MSKQPLLSVRSLYKSYLSGRERLSILRGLELTVEPGQMIAVTGASGSGKSTLLHLVGGMDYPDRGEVRYQGINIFEFSRQELARFRNATIGFVFQFHHLLPEFTALENVMFPLLIRGVSRQQARRPAEELLARVGLGDRLGHRPGELSGGEQQRVAIARALVGRPKVLLADEPTGNLDTHTAEAIFTLLLSLHREAGLTSVVVTHNERLALLCDRSYRLEEGRLEPAAV